MKKLLLVVFSFFCLLPGIYSQITTTVNPTIAQMQSALQGNGVVVTGLTITCPAGAYAMFGNGAAALGGGLNNGILLTTGTASNVAGPPSGFNSVDNSSSGGAGSALGNTLSGGTTYDGCYLNFMITPNCSTLSIKYVFASEEYPEYTTGGINDVFGFVLSGPNPSGPVYNQTNIAVLPVTTTTTNVVSIENVNNGTAGAGPCVNCAYYVNNPPGLIYDGATTVLTASANVTPCQTYTMTIGVWDDADGVYDSGVFLDVNGLSCIGNPTITAVISPSVICGPQTVTLTAGGGLASGTYTWSAPPSGGLVSTNGQTVTANPTATTVYTVSYSDINTCPGVPLTKQATLTFSASPGFSVTRSPNTSICAGQSVTLTATGGAGTYSWTPATGLSATAGSVVVSSPTVTTTYTVTKTTAGGCVNSTVTTVSVTSASSLSVTPNGSNICPGQSATLTASGGTTYTWTASSGANPPSSATISISPSTTTTYTVHSACSSSAAVTVTVSAATSVSVSPASSSICSSQSITLTAIGGSTYTWTASSGANPPNAATVVVTPSANTTYTVLTGSGSCTASAVATVSFGAISTTVTGSSPTYCMGGTPVSLTASGASTYSWSPTTGLSSATGAVVTATPAVTTVYSVTGTSGSCSSVKTITVTVPPTSTVTVTGTGTLICAGGPGTTLTASGAATYTWMPGALTTASINANPAATTTYTVGGQTASGCIAVPAVVTVSVAPAITPTATSSSPSVCVSQTVSLSVAPTGAGLNYAWAPASAIQGSTTTATVIALPTSSAVVIYTVTVSNGLCSGTATVELDPFVCVPPTADIEALTNDSICTKGCVTFTANTTGSQPMVYQWVFPGGTPSTSTSSNPEVCYFSKGTYSVGLMVTNAYGRDSIIKGNFISVADTPAVFNATGDTTLKVGQTATLTAHGATSYVWSPNINNSISCPTCSITVVQPTVTTKYMIEESNSPYCKRIDYVLVKVDFTCGDFFVPNAFSPNGDGLNDMINVHGFCIGTYDLQIFDRWGEKVFETTSLSESWDGTFRGKNMDTGVFVYRADGVTIDGKPFNIKGNITLIR